jgi:hypothetical protein
MVGELPDEPLLLVSSEQLNALYAAVRERLRGEPCDDTPRHTREWASAAGLPVERLLAGLRRFGGFCDCRVVVALRVLAPDTSVPYALWF